MITVQALDKPPATDKDIWLSDKSNRGEGQFCARITKAGKRSFYFRYSGPDGKQARYCIGTYDPQGRSGYTLKDARNEAKKLSLLYRSGMTDIRGHLAEQQRLEPARVTDELLRLESERREAESRLTVEQYFKQWADDELSKRKDGGKESIRQITKDVIPSLATVIWKMSARRTFD